MFNAFLTTKGRGLDNAKFIFISFVFHCFLLSIFWRLGGEKQTNAPLPVNISLSNVVIEKSGEAKLQPQARPQKQKTKESSKPLPKQEAIESETLKSGEIKESIVRSQQEEDNFIEAPKQTVQTKTTSPQAAAQISKADFEIIREMAIANLVYPSIARRMGWSGVVHISLTIDANGKLVDSKIYQSSNKELLDNTALEAVKALKNQALPKPQSASTIILPIAFKLK